MDRFHVTPWYKFSDSLKTFLVESDKFSRKRSTVERRSRMFQDRVDTALERLIRNCAPLGPYSRTMPRALW